VLDELALASLHAIEEDDAEVVAGCDPLERHNHCGDHPASLIVVVLAASKVLAESVHDDQLEVGQPFDHLLELLVEQELIALVEDAHVVDAREDLFERELVSVPPVLRRVLVNVFEHLSAKRLRHFLHPIVGKVSMSVNVESLAFDATESPRHLDVQAKLEADLGLTGACQATDFNDFSKAEDHVQKVLLVVICLHLSHIDKLLHEEDKLSFLPGATSYGANLLRLHRRLFNREVQGLRLENPLENTLYSIHFCAKLLSLVVCQLRVFVKRTSSV